MTLRLDQISVDNIITSIVESEELKKDQTVGKTESSKTQDGTTVGDSATAEPLPEETEDQARKEPVVVKGALKTKTYSLKKNLIVSTLLSVVSVML